MEKGNSFMRTRPVFSLLVSMSVPMMLSMLIQSLYNIVDSIYVSRLGTDALTAVSLAYPLQNAIVSVGVGIGVGISSAISIHLGSGDQEKADRAASLGIILTVFHCILFVLAGIFITRPFLRLFTEDPAILKDACDYTYVVLCLSFGALLQIAFEKIFQSIGKMKITMYLLIAGCVINIILDPILIFGLLGFPALGVTGAAIATVIGQICAFLLYIVVYLRKPYAVRIRIKYMKPDWKIIKQIYSVGIPSSIMMLLPSVLISLLNRILTAFSSLYVAVLGVYFKLQTFIYMPANGIVQGMRPIIGYNYGAGRWDRVRENFFLLVRTGVIFESAVWILILICPQIFIGIFTNDPELTAYCVRMIRIYFATLFVLSLQNTCQNTFLALGNAKTSLLLALERKVFLLIPMIYILPLIWKSNQEAAVFLAEPISDCIAAATTVTMFLLQYRKKLFVPKGQQEEKRRKL